jgi:hypothetical protein
LKALASSSERGWTEVEPEMEMLPDTGVLVTVAV